MRGYRRPGPLFTWYGWWGIMLIDDEEAEEERRILRAEDEAIAAAEAGPQPQAADIVALMEALNGGGQGDAGRVAEPDRGDGHRGA